jgi:putative membrane protein
MNSKRVYTRIIVIAGAAAVLSTALAQAPQQNPGQPQPTFPGGTQSGTRPMDQPDASSSNGLDHSMMDKAFVRKAIEGGLAKVQLGQLALQKSQNSDVKQFAQKMVDDHTQMGDQMKVVAVKVDVKPPTSPSKKDKAMIAKLEALSGPDFDKAYIKTMVKDHQQDEKDFKEESQLATIPEVKEAAMAGEHVINSHLQMIEQIAQNNGGVASSK